MVASGLSQDPTRVVYFHLFCPFPPLLSTTRTLILSGFHQILLQCLLSLDGLVRRFTRDDDGVHFDKPSPSYDHKDFVALEVKAGSLVVLHGDLVHQRLVTFSESSIIFDKAVRCATYWYFTFAQS